MGMKIGIICRDEAGVGSLDLEIREGVFTGYYGYYGDWEIWERRVLQAAPLPIRFIC